MRARPSDFRPERTPTRRPPAAGHLGSQEKSKATALAWRGSLRSGGLVRRGAPRSAPWLLPPPPLSRPPRQVGSRCIPKRNPGANFAPSASKDLSRTALAGLSLCMESRSPGGDLDSEPVLLVRSLRSLAISTRRCSIPAICGFSKCPPTAACVSLGVRWVSALPQTSASGTFRLRHSVGVWAYDLNRSAP
jgi:hypothetical protein